MDHLRVMWNGVQKVNISSNCFKVMKTTFDMGPEILKWFLIPFSINILNLINRYPRDSIETQCPYTNLAHVNLFHNVHVGISVRWFIPSEFELWKKTGLKICWTCLLEKTKLKKLLKTIWLRGVNAIAKCSAHENISAISKPYAKIFPHANQEKKSRDTFNFTMQNRRDTS